MKYFTDCKTAEDVKKAFRKWALKLHPDNNQGRDTTEEFQEMQAEFEAAFDRLKNVHVNKDGETYEKETTETAGEFMDLIIKLLNLDGVSVELCGSWIWLTGNTKEHRDAIKALHFKWSSNKAAWHFHREPYRKRSKKSMSLDAIRAMYGSRSFYKADSETDRDSIPAYA